MGESRQERNRTPTSGRSRALDDADRRLLALLSEDASLSYAALGAAVGLSAPAVHERVKRLKQAGVVRGTVALVDPAAVGRPFGAFVHLETDVTGRAAALESLRALPDVEEIHTVAGDACYVAKVRTRDTRTFENLLATIRAIPGVRFARTYVILSSPLERPPRALPPDPAPPDPDRPAPRPPDRRPPAPRPSGAEPPGPEPPAPPSPARR